MIKRAACLALCSGLLLSGGVAADQLTGYFGAGGTVPIKSSAPIQTQDTSQTNGLPQATISSIGGNVPASSTTVTLAAPSSVIDIWTSPDAAPLHINWTGGTATSGNGAIAPGSTYRFNGRGTTIQTFKILGDSAAGTYGVFAN